MPKTEQEIRDIILKAIGRTPDDKAVEDITWFSNNNQFMKIEDIIENYYCWGE